MNYTWREVTEPSTSCFQRRNLQLICFRNTVISIFQCQTSAHYIEDWKFINFLHFSVNKLVLRLMVKIFKYMFFFPSEHYFPYAVVVNLFVDPISAFWTMGWWGWKIRFNSWQWSYCTLTSEEGKWWLGLKYKFV